MLKRNVRPHSLPAAGVYATSLTEKILFRILGSNLDGVAGKGSSGGRKKGVV